MAQVFSEYGDVNKTRDAADKAADRADIAASESPSLETIALAHALNGVRLEIRAAAQTISSALGAAVDELRGEMRGER